MPIPSGYKSSWESFFFGNMYFLSSCANTANEDTIIYIFVDANEGGQDVVGGIHLRSEIR